MIQLIPEEDVVCEQKAELNDDDEDVHGKFGLVAVAGNGQVADTCYLLALEHIPGLNNQVSRTRIERPDDHHPQSTGVEAIHGKVLGNHEKCDAHHGFEYVGKSEAKSG